MQIKELTYINHITGWNVRNMNINKLTLLVGASGVGKTQILKSILSLAKVANGRSLNGVEWCIEFTIDKNQYEWRGCFDQLDSIETNLFTDRIVVPIAFESLKINDLVFVHREGSKIIYRDEETIKLDSNKSVVALLKEEQDVAPIYQAFRRVYKLNTDRLGVKVSPIKDIEEKQPTLQEIKMTTRLSLVEKLFMLRKFNFPEYTQIKDTFIDIFPSVQDIDFATVSLFDDTTAQILKIKERGVESWIGQSDISSGMHRTLLQIIALNLAIDGDIILIDEFENGLGINCINILADYIINPDADIQVIMTSHHPYIINSIPVNRWNIVTRDISDIYIYTASDLNIGQHSHHDAFMQLMQTPQFKTGVK